MSKILVAGTNRYNNDIFKARAIATLKASVDALPDESGQIPTSQIKLTLPNLRLTT